MTALIDLQKKHASALDAVFYMAKLRKDSLPTSLLNLPLDPSANLAQQFLAKLPENPKGAQIFLCKFIEYARLKAQLGWNASNLHQKHIECILIDLQLRAEQYEKSLESCAESLNDFSLLAPIQEGAFFARYMHLMESWKLPSMRDHIMVCINKERFLYFDKYLCNSYMPEVRENPIIHSPFEARLNHEFVLIFESLQSAQSEQGMGLIAGLSPLFIPWAVCYCFYRVYRWFYPTNTQKPSKEHNKKRR